MRRSTPADAARPAHEPEREHAARAARGTQGSAQRFTQGSAPGFAQTPLPRSRPHRRIATAVAVGTAVILALTACAPRASYDGGRGTARDVGVQLFQWNWDSIATECSDVLGPAGVGWVLTSPPQEHITGSAWWTAYQPVSYRIESRLGTRDQFASMVSTCHAAGVKVVADAVINHMTGQDAPGTGWSPAETTGSSYDHYDYPGLYSDANGDFHHCGLSPSDDIGDYSSQGEVQTCELVNLADLATETDHVRSTIAGYLNDLMSLGVDGFRIDAAKHIPADDIAAILTKVNGDPFIVQEVIRGDGEPIQPEQYLDNGDVFEFGYATQLQTWLTTGQLGNVSHIDGYGFVDSAVARTFVENHDTERNHSTLSYRDGARDQLATILTLAIPYGSPVLYSGYAFTAANEGLPQDADGRVTDVACVSDPGPVQPGADVTQPTVSTARRYLDGEWICQHRWPATLAMVQWRAAVSDAPVTDEVSDGTTYAFGRGDRGFIAFNASGLPITQTFATSLAAGSYLDVIGGGSFTVAADGSVTVTIAPWSAVALQADTSEG
jgi:alpha-amylase